MNDEVTRVIMGYAKEGKKQANQLFSNVLGANHDDDEHQDVN